MARHDQLPGQRLRHPAIRPKADQGAARWGQIVAYQNGTTVDIVPAVGLPSGTHVSAAPKNVKTT